MWQAGCTDTDIAEFVSNLFGKECFDSDDSLAPSDPTPQSIDTTSVLPRLREYRPSPRQLQIPKNPATRNGGGGGNSDISDDDA